MKVKPVRFHTWNEILKWFNTGYPKLIIFVQFMLPSGGQVILRNGWFSKEHN